MIVNQKHLVFIPRSISARMKMGLCTGQLKFIILEIYFTKKRWIDNVKKDLESVGVAGGEGFSRMRDREGWRVLSSRTKRIQEMSSWS